MRTTVFLVVVSCAATTVLGAVPVIHDLGVFPNGFMTISGEISHDGKFVTGYGSVITNNANNYAFRWSFNGGLVNLGVPLGGLNSRGFTINHDGTAIGVLTDFNKLCRWTVSNGMQDLGVTVTSLADMSGDGSMMVGNVTLPDTTTRGYYWTPNTGLVQLPFLNQDNVSLPEATAQGVSHDGTVILGSTSDVTPGQHACMWTLSGIQLLTVPPSTDSYAMRMSRNGQVVVGLMFAGGYLHLTRAVLPNPAVDLGGALGPANFGIGGTNYDGKVIVGAGAGTALYWSTGAGMRDLNIFLPQLGTNLGGWVLDSATGVSDDGSTIVGTGMINFQYHAFVITGMPCPSTALIQVPPMARSVCGAPGSHATLSMVVDAPGEVIYRWSVESPADSGVFEPITGPFFADSSGQRFRAEGWEGPELTIFDLQPAAGKPNITILPAVTNPCGITNAAPVQVALCPADLDCNEIVDDADFVEFVGAYNELVCPGGGIGLPAYCPGDLNGDAVVDDVDFGIFVGAYDALLCV